jgi:hypothetical protein
MIEPEGTMSYMDACTRMVKMPTGGIADWYLTVVGYVRPDGSNAYRYISSAGASSPHVVYALGSIIHDVYADSDPKTGGPEE